MKILLHTARVFVGLLFIFSGLIKANDPLGLSYKMQEFFEVWHFNFLNDFTLGLSVLMIVFEIVAGIAVLLGWRMKIFSWLLLILIIFFTFLTGYAYLSGKIRECGCFGNCIPLTAGESFAKDILLTILIIFLFIKQSLIKPVLSNIASITVLVLTTILSFSLQWFVLQQLPVVDCLPYKIGANIIDNMKVPPHAIPDSSVITFVYNKNGREIEFTSDKFPADFDDTYKFTRRYDKLIRKGNAEPAIKDFILSLDSGQDITNAILKLEGNKLFLIAKEFTDADPSWSKEFSVILSFTFPRKIPVFLITAEAVNAKTFADKNGFTDKLVIVSCDATAIKTAARVNPTLYLINNATIVNKWAGADFEEALSTISVLPAQQAPK